MNTLGLLVLVVLSGVCIRLQRQLDRLRGGR